MTAVDWPDGREAHTEPSCADHYQPYGAIELSYITTMIANTVIDELLKASETSYRRIWVSGRQAEYGGTIGKAFTDWEKHGVHPFGERDHGGAGIARFYIDRLGLADEVQALEVALHLLQHGYRGHHDCPCGSGAKLRNCHGPALLELDRNHTAESARCDFGEILRHCLKRVGDGELALPAELERRLLRQGNRKVRRPGLRATQDRAKRDCG